jgi:hypothetical protein
MLRVSTFFWHSRTPLNLIVRPPFNLRSYARIESVSSHRVRGVAVKSAIDHCSCHSCRMSHAAAFKTSAAVKHRHFTWVKGAELLTSYPSSPGKTRRFCSRCGTQLVAQISGKDNVILRVATLDDDPGVTPEFQIRASHEAPWLSCGKHIVAHAEWEPESA